MASREPTLRRRRDEGHHPTPFRDVRTLRWISAGAGALVLLAALPFLWPETAQWSQRLATAASMVFLVAAPGLAIGMRSRAFVVAAFVVAMVYAATATTGLAFDFEDFFLVAVLVGFGLFALAGFNLVFILEEMVFDAHRLLHPSGRIWKAFLPTASAGLTIGLPVWAGAGGPWSLPIWLASVASTILLGGWWFLRLFNDLPEEPTMQELHMFCIGILGATGLTELLGLLDAHSTGIGASVVAYVALLGTWMYVSYTTLQRTHFLLGGRNTMPWVSLLLAASFAILVHAQIQFRAVGEASIPFLLQRRVSFLVTGIWIGLSFYVVRNTFLALRAVREWAALGPGGRMAVGKAARVAEELLGTDQRLGHAVGRVLRGIDARLPHGWQLEPEGVVAPIEQEQDAE